MIYVPAPQLPEAGDVMTVVQPDGRRQQFTVTEVIPGAPLGGVTLELLGDPDNDSEAAL